MAKILMGKCHSETIGHAVREAASEGIHELVKLLLMECEARHLEESWYYSHVGMAVQNAALRSDLEMAKLLIAKCDPPSAGRVLQMEVANDHTDMLRLFAPMTGVYYKEDPYKVNALVRTAKKVKTAMVEILAQYSDQPTMEAALLRLSSNGDLVATKLLLRKLDPASYKHTFAIAAEKIVVQLVEILLEHMDPSNIRWALMTATSKGYLGTVKSMLHKCETASIGCALEVAVLKNKLAVIDVLRKRCKLRTTVVRQLESLAKRERRHLHTKLRGTHLLLCIELLGRVIRIQESLPYEILNFRTCKEGNDATIANPSSSLIAGLDRLSGRVARASGGHAIIFKPMGLNTLLFASRESEAESVDPQLDYSSRSSSI
ncbi:hypothetical protein PC121_g20960 [Phytophthora cactorum]|nr:hypothetical protein PC121_g20960 [Phytophthora cactorum]